MGGIGAIISFLVDAKLYDINQAYPFWMGSILVIIASLLVFTFIKEPKTYEAAKERPDLIKSLGEVIRDPERSALRILLAILLWFIAYNAIEAFFTLYANKHLLMAESDGARLLGQLSLLFVIFSLPAGYIGARFGRRNTIISGILLMTLAMLLMYLLPVNTLTIPLTKLPLVGLVPVVGLILMLAGIAWALININSLPMVVDMTTLAKVGTYTGLYYLFSTVAAILGPNLNGWIVELTGRNYRYVMIVGPIFMLAALVMMIGVKRGEAQPQE